VSKLLLVTCMIFADSLLPLMHLSTPRVSLASHLLVILNMAVRPAIGLKAHTASGRSQSVNFMPRALPETDVRAVSTNL